MRDGQKWPLRIELVRFRLFNFNLSVFSGASLGLHVESVLLKGVPLRHTLSRQCNSLKLDVGVLWERLNSNTAASRLVGEPLAVLLVHGSKVVHVIEEDVDFDNLVDVRTSSHENGLEVADASSGLLLDGALDQVALGVKMNLARAIDCRWRLDGLGVRPSRRGSIFGEDDIHGR